jgi:hypothetical protein
MFDHYVKLFHLTWIEPWMAEAMAIIVGSLFLVFVICKAMDCFNGEQQ